MARMREEVAYPPVEPAERGFHNVYIRCISGPPRSGSRTTHTHGHSPLFDQRRNRRCRQDWAVDEQTSEAGVLVGLEREKRATTEKQDSTPLGRPAADLPDSRSNGLDQRHISDTDRGGPRYTTDIDVVEEFDWGWVRCLSVTARGGPGNYSVLGTLWGRLLCPDELDPAGEGEVTWTVFSVRMWQGRGLPLRGTGKDLGPARPRLRRARPGHQANPQERLSGCSRNADWRRPLHFGGSGADTSVLTAICAWVGFPGPG